MFTVKEIGTETCIACGRSTECVQIEDNMHAISGWLCLADFRKQLRVLQAVATSAAGNGRAASEKTTSLHQI